MKRLLLGLFATVAFSMGSMTAFAQTFSFQHGDTVNVLYSGGTIDVHNDIVIPNGGTPMYLRWAVISSDFSSIPTWSTDTNVSMCDNYNCFSGTQLLSGTSYMSALYNVGQGPFKLTLNLAYSVSGTHYITINLKDSMSSFNKNMTFMVTKFPTSVTGVRKNTQEISLYPNPATDDLNVLFDEEDNIKNIAVYNVIGKAMLVYKVNGRSAKMDISKLPNGVYFIRLSDSKGQVVGTKRFTKQ